MEAAENFSTSPVMQSFGVSPEGGHLRGVLLYTVVTVYSTCTIVIYTKVLSAFSVNNAIIMRVCLMKNK